MAIFNSYVKLPEGNPSNPIIADDSHNISQKMLRMCY